MKRLLMLATLALTASAHAADAPPLYSAQQLTPETALAAAQAALAHCRLAGHQVAVAVVDRSGLVQVLLRDRFAGAHTLDIAPRKAWTAASFRMPTATLAAETQAGKTMSGIRQSTQVMAIGGGQVIEAAGSIVGAIGVSGAPGAEADDACALAGVRAVTALIELHD
ncbi:heme-binding protein [Roseateles sp.]|uniref:GlcG/HbpS family heme-binding protein n=1 Tax=Roseateles sp. TaxID=1971397 RepID=UPI0025D9D589|nr:heme-binding protein [Roseateles sp.]MBV8037671.1 heme-binding protein [Roseateles sp.]